MKLSQFIATGTVLPLALAAPTIPFIPELSIKEWQSIQSTFSSGLDSLSGLSRWSWNTASDTLDALDQQMADRLEEPEEDWEIVLLADESKTIWEQLKADPSYSKIVKVIEFEEEAIKYLDGKEMITFFAPNNDALKPPHGHHGHQGHHDHDHDDDGDDDELLGLFQNPSLASVSALLEQQPSLFVADDGDDDDDDDKKKRRRKIIKYIVGKLLQYHGLKEPVSAQELAGNSTWPTALQAEDGSFGGLQRRIKVSKTLIPPAVKLNFYATVIKADQKAVNGYFHTINHPLLPGPDMFDTAYFFPDLFSTLTSATQKVDGQKFLTWSYDHEASKPGKPKFTGTPAATLFAPTNGAFAILPPGLKLYLFSPFGDRAMKKLLSYHYIPKTLLMTELMYTEGEEDLWGLSDGGEKVEYFKDDTFHGEFNVNTALNETVHIEIDKTKVLPIEGGVKITLKVNGQTALENDGQCRNGVIHTLAYLLVPPHKHHDEDGVDVAAFDSFENWEEWLPAWAEA